VPKKKKAAAKTDLDIDYEEYLASSSHGRASCQAFFLQE